MIVNKITPQGFCGGVTNALKILDNAINDSNTKKPIYLLGQIIHNKHIVEDLSKKGVIIIEDKNKTRLELLDLINDGTVVFSAHGVSPSVREKAQNKNLNIIDTTCPYVLSVHNKIKQYLSCGYTCIYIGTKGHPECEGVLGIDNSILLVSNALDIDNLNINSTKIYVTNQTTLSIFEISKLYELLKEKYSNIVIEDKICNATTLRQEALAKQKKVDLCIIVGDKASSNTLKLYDVSKNISKNNTILVEDLSQLDENLIKGVKEISISSGASTPSSLVDEIIDFLININ